MAEYSTDDLKEIQRKASQNKHHGGPGGANMMQSGDKAKHFSKAMKNLAKYLAHYKWQLLLTAIFAIASTVFAIMSPKILGNMTNQIVDDYIKIQAYDSIVKQLPKGTVIPKGTNLADLQKLMTAQAETAANAQLAKINAIPDANARSTALASFQAEMAQQKAASEKQAAEMAAATKKIPADQLKEIKAMDLSVKPKMDFAKLGQFATFLIFIYFASAIFGYAQGFILTGVTQRIAFRFRKDISEKINRLPLRYFDTRAYGDVLSRITNDVDTISQSLTQTISQALTSVTMVIGIIIMMLSIDWQLTGISIFVLLVSFGLVAVVVKNTQKYFKSQQDQLGELNGHIEETYAGHQVVKAFGGEKNAEQKFSRTNKKLFTSAWKSQFLSGLMWPIMNFVGNLGYVAVAVFGGWKAIHGYINIGDIQAFIQYVQQFNQPIMQISQIANVIQSTAASSERVFEFLDEPEEEE